MNVNNSLLGLYPDVTYHSPDRRLYVAYTDGAARRIKVVPFDGEPGQPIFDVPCENQGFVKIRSVGDSLLLLFRDGTGTTCHLHNLTLNTHSDWPGRFYNWPCALGSNGFALNDSTELVVRDYSFNVISRGLPFPGTGIAFLKDDNAPVSWDANNGSMGQHGILNPRWVGELVCGEGDSGGVGVIHESSGKKTVFLQTPVPTFEPRIAQYRDRYAIVTGDYKTINVLTDITVAEVIGMPVPSPGGRVIEIEGPLNVGDVIRIVQ